MKALVLFVAFYLISICAWSQIFYQDISPDVVLSSWGVKHVHIDSNANSTLPYGAAGILSIWREGSSGPVVVNTFSDCEVLMEGDYPAALNKGLIISSSAVWVKPYYALLCNGSSGNWKGVNDKYLGVRIKNGSQWIYGWIRMDVNSDGSSVTIKDYACNRKAGSEISAGQTITTGLYPVTDHKADLIIINPEPAKKQITFQFSTSDYLIETVHVYNLKGCMLKTITDIYNSSVTVHVSCIPEGLYVYSIMDKYGKFHSGKFIFR